MKPTKPKPFGTVWSQATEEEKEILRKAGDITYRCRQNGLVKDDPNNPDNAIFTVTEEQEKILEQATAILER